MSSDTTPKVSVCMITYGHEAFIEQAILGVLEQQADFDIELVISNDRSPDSSDMVINEIIKTHPSSHRIRYTNQTKNLGVIPNLLYAISQCEGDYIAMCEGDDYWIDKDKLAKQVGILDQHEEYGLSYTHFKFFDQVKQQFVDVPERHFNDARSVEQMLISKFIEFPTIVIRKELLLRIVEILGPEFKKAMIGDTRIFLEASQLSKLHYLDHVTTVYRVLPGSASHATNIDKYIFALLDSYRGRKEFVKRYDLKRSWLSHAICNTNRGLINKAFTASRYTEMLKCLRNMLVSDTIKYCNTKVFFKKMTLKVFVKLILAMIGLGVLRQKMKKQ